MALSHREAALGLYRYGCEPPDGSLFQRFYWSITELFAAWGIVVTHLGADGAGYAGTFTKAGGRVHSRLLQSNFAEVINVSLAATPEGSDAPAYDSFASATLSYSEAQRELLACVVVDESFLTLDAPEYDQLLRSLVALHPWDFGYGFTAATAQQPSFHILGIDNGKLSPADYKSLCTWYNATPDTRTTRLRGVYPSNLLNERQLSALLSHGKTLRQFIESDPASSITRLTDDGLHLWKLPASDAARMQDALLAAGALVREAGE